MSGKDERLPEKTMSNRRCHAIRLIVFIFLPLMVSFAGLINVASSQNRIDCQGRYRHHLQGICRDDTGHVYWSFTTTLVKTDSRGAVVGKIETPNHHGDLCHRQGKLYVAVNFGKFDHVDGLADNWIYTYNAADLKLLDRVSVPQVAHGAGGIAYHDGRFMVVGGLPDGVEENYVYEYDQQLQFRKRHVIPSGHTKLGIQTATYSDGSWWFGCYGNTLLKVNTSLDLEGRYRFDCGLGIESIGRGRFLIGRGQNGEDGCHGWAISQENVRFQQREDTQPIQRILFGSCIKQQNETPILATILRKDPELFLFLGDNIYADTANMSLMKKKYDQLAALPGFRELVSDCRVLATWDDHDYGLNDGGSDFEKRVESQQVFVDFWRDPLDSPRRSRPGVYLAHTFGPDGQRLQVILLDTRYFRGPLQKGEQRRVGGPYIPNRDATVSMLGQTQWEWLEAQLRRPAEFRIVVTSIQCVAEDDGQETWSNLPLERTRFFELLANTGARNVVLLSGDRHWSELSMTDEPGFPLYELTSSSLNQVHPRGTPTRNKFRHLATTVHQPNFGILQFDWGKRKLELQIVGLDGTKQFGTRIDFNDSSRRE
jgi:alkaline phosphatase D